MTASSSIKTPAMEVPLLPLPEAQTAGERLRKHFTRVCLDQVYIPLSVSGFVGATVTCVVCGVSLLLPFSHSLAGFTTPSVRDLAGSGEGGGLGDGGSGRQRAPVQTVPAETELPSPPVLSGTH